MASTHVAPVNLPRVAITYCTQCRWMLRAAYFGQELLSTFGTQIGEIALIPATGGLFQVELAYVPPTLAGGEEGDVKAEKILLWDRKTEGGFPETKVLKQRVRDRIDPKKDLGHSDVGGKKKDAVKIDEGKSLKAEVKPDVKVDGQVERIAEEMAKNLQIEDAPDEVDVTSTEDAQGQSRTDGYPEIAGVKVDGKVEKNAEDMVKDMQLEDAPDGADIKKNPDGTICEDCR